MCGQNFAIRNNYNDSALPHVHPVESHELFNYHDNKLVTCSVASLAKK